MRKTLPRARCGDVENCVDISWGFSVEFKCLKNLPLSANGAKTRTCEDTTVVLMIKDWQLTLMVKYNLLQ